MANSWQRNVFIVDDHEVDDPVESGARQYELRVERCIAAPLALDLLRESGDLARETWSWLQWLQSRIAIRRWGHLSTSARSVASRCLVLGMAIRIGATRMIVLSVR